SPGLPLLGAGPVRFFKKRWQPQRAFVGIAERNRESLCKWHEKCARTSQNREKFLKNERVRKN
ncbi:MAG: hypothetical protein IIV90_06300, partial [Oscillospiraceae bacterium]|nr:hypothetical protein [Oscillospiraceae bacterium]